MCRGDDNLKLLVLTLHHMCSPVLSALQDDTVRTKEGLDDAAGVAVVFDEDDEDEVLYQG